MEVSIVIKLVYNLLKGLITYLYRGYNPVTKYHGHPFNEKKGVHVIEGWAPLPGTVHKHIFGSKRLAQFRAMKDARRMVV